MVPNELSPKLQYFRHTKEQKFFCPKRVTTKCARHSQMWEVFISINIIFLKKDEFQLQALDFFVTKKRRKSALVCQFLGGQVNYQIIICIQPTFFVQQKFTYEKPS